MTTRRRSFILFTALLAIAAPAGAQPHADAVDLRSVVIHDSPADVADWPVTVHIDRLTMSVPAGLAFDFSGVPDSWDYHVPGWGVGTGCPADGCVLYTVWAIARVQGALHAAGFIQMWRGRPATGAPILSDFHKNWAYARDRWGELADYAPEPGDLMGFFVTAGNARDVKDVTSRRERSNVVIVRLPANDAGVFEFAAAPSVAPPAVVIPFPPIALPPLELAPPPVVSAPPAPPVLPATDLTPVYLRFDLLEHKIDDFRASFESAMTEVRTTWKQVAKKVTEWAAVIVPALLAGRATK